MRKIIVILSSLLFLNVTHASNPKDPILTISAIMFEGNAVTSTDNANTWQSNPITTNSNINLVDTTWANNQFVAIGYDTSYYSGISFTSPDGIHWNAASYLSGYLGRVIYANNIYFATGNNTGLFSSTDGKTWGSSPAPMASGCTMSDLAGIAWGNGTYVLTGLCMGGNQEQYFTATSTDALNWIVTPQQFSFNDVIWNQNQFVAVGYLGVAATSADGINWTQRFGDNGISFSRVIYANNMYVAIGTGGTYPNNASAILTSPDGVNWTERPFKTKKNLILAGLAYKNNQFIVGAYDLLSNSSRIYTSPDAVTWTLRTTRNNSTVYSIG